MTHEGESIGCILFSLYTLSIRDEDEVLRSAVTHAAQTAMTEMPNTQTDVFLSLLANDHGALSTL